MLVVVEWLYLVHSVLPFYYVGAVFAQALPVLVEMIVLAALFVILLTFASVFQSSYRLNQWGRLSSFLSYPGRIAVRGAQPIRCLICSPLWQELHSSYHYC